MAYYPYTKDHKKRILTLAAKIDAKLAKLSGEDNKTQNKKAHLKECLNSLNLILSGDVGDDRYDFFIYDIYTIEWGMDEELNPKRQDKNVSGIKSLKEIAKNELKDSVDEFIFRSEIDYLRRHEIDVDIL